MPLLADRRLLPLANGGEAIVDADVYEIARRYRWHRRREGYVARTSLVADGPPVGRKIFLHHLVVGRRPGFVVDHINRDRLDNRRCNLRFATNQQNAFNASSHRDSKTGVKGVDYDPRRRKWVARIGLNGKTTMLGRFASLAEAIEARRAAEKALHGEFASVVTDG